MRFVLVIALSLVVAGAEAGDADLREFAERYFEAWHATQQPGATPEVLEAYLALLDDDVGYEHKPHRLLGEVAGGKARMREGMTFYLGKNTAYDASLVSVATAHNAVALQYQGTHVFRRGGDGPELTEAFTAMDVLEVSGGKVTIIRHYRD